MSLSYRILHWTHSRVGFFHVIVFLLWLGERAKYESAPPMAIWLVYFHVGLCFLASTGLSARLLPRLSTWLMVASHLHLAYLYLNEYRLAYPSWLRLRLTWRNAMSIAVYLRMLGVTDSSAKSGTGLRGSEPIGLFIMALSAGAVGVTSLPVSVLKFYEELQVIDTVSTWQTETLGSVVGLLLGCTLLLASFCYALCLVALPVGSGSTWSSRYLLSERSVLFADGLTIFAFCGLTVLRDCNFYYWKVMDVEFWLEVRLLLDNFVLISGILITHHLLQHRGDTVSFNVSPTSKVKGNSNR